MAELVDIEEVRKQRNAPDRNCRSTDLEGHPLFLFSTGYRHRGRRFSLDIWARSEEDAAAQIASIRETIWLEGQVVVMETWHSGADLPDCD